MNRSEEYAKLLKELEQPVPALAYTLQRAEVKRKKRNLILKPLTGFAVLCLAFVLSVNLLAPVADACSKIPVLKELAEAVTFSNSLSDAVEHDYAQPINLKKTEKGVTVSVEYLIVDQKQVNIFFRVDSKRYEHLDFDPTILGADGGSLACSYAFSWPDTPSDGLESITVDFTDQNVPSSMKMLLQFYDEDALEETPVEDPEFPEVTKNPHPYIAEFSFLLEFDPAFTAAVKKIPVDETVVLDGQKVTFTELEIYPTQMRIGAKTDKSNRAWLTDLDLYILADGTKKFKPTTNGTTSTGSTESREMDTYYCDSAYFYEAKELSIVVTGARFLDKAHYKYHVNLKTGKSEKLPYGIKITSVKQKKNRWKITFDNDDKLPPAWVDSILDSQGNEYHINMRDSQGNIYFEDYPEEEAWLLPYYNREWKPVAPVGVVVK